MEMWKLIYQEELPPDIGPVKDILEEYSGIDSTEVEAHLHTIREKAWNATRYPCIGRWRFLYIDPSSDPRYQRVLSRLTSWRSSDVLLDLGCGVGQSLRQFSYDGVHASKLIGLDINPTLIEIGFELFRDRHRTPAGFVVGNMMDDVDEGLEKIDGRISIVHASNFWHLFNWTQQLAMAVRLVRFFKMGEKRAMIYGRHSPRPRTPIFRHDGSEEIDEEPTADTPRIEDPRATPRDIYGEMLTEAGVNQEVIEPARPLKRRMVRRRTLEIGDTAPELDQPSAGPASVETKVARELDETSEEEEEEEEEDIVFEDVVIPKPTIQTVYMTSDDEGSEGTDDDDDDDDDDKNPGVAFEDVDMRPPVATVHLPEPQRKDIELNLSAQKAAMSPMKRGLGRKKRPLSKEEKKQRLEVHKVHVLCLLYHCAMRNRWCNDAKVQGCLKKLLSQRMLNSLNPSRTLSQFGRTEALKAGLQEVGQMYRSRYQVTERGLRRALWAEDPDEVGDFDPPTDLEACLDRSDFLQVAKTLHGSRDVSAQEPSDLASPGKAAASGSSTALSTPPRRRFGLSTTASHYRRPPTTSPRSSKSHGGTPRKIKESHFPIYWVEVLDVAHQKWQPNSLSYVVAFDEDGAVKDVTKRYAKAYTAKTLRLRVESAEEQGARWWRKALRKYSRRRPTDLDQIEDNELAAALAREPIPSNIADFKHHPLYVLQRHLRRNEVLQADARDVGTVAAGSRAPLERVYLRRNVMVARSKEKWYRSGRVVKDNEIPAKWLPPRKQTRRGEDDEDDDENVQGDAGTPLYLLEHTEEFHHPPVLAARAAFILGVDYAPALTGFKFKGRHGTAVLSGVVVAAEYAEAVRAVIKGLVDLETEIEEDRKRKACLQAWRRLLMGLRIRQKIWEGVDEDLEAQREAEKQVDDEARGDSSHALTDAEIEDAASDVTEEYEIREEDDYGGGGFFVE
ncbi:unnamed protein product [Parascedosporium putredinis]|uniref:Rad4-domain-containing protein n=1 Tax=Parascedosporium putredinis TaxID=1442378 RepID=A0A9P1H536_9PEZI|nr:unnamed protein product [Parascedosporium putredinis]CAI7996054.1 unnamed protein product [Parascedosporium putredinis]